MSTRPPIPRPLRRRIYLEAGHRCAIQTCLATEIDVHHIVPWERCREHSYENLIALCPNCHRRAGRGDIDERSLRIYKARLAAAFQLSGTAPIVSTSGSFETITLNISESSASFPKYALDIAYPQIVSPEADTDEINVALKAHAVAQLHEFRRDYLDDPLFDESHWSASQESYLETGYGIAYASSELLSVRFSTMTYVAGAAHPNYQSAVLNFRRSPTAQMTLESLFKDGRLAAQRLSDLAKPQLQEELGEFYWAESVDRGASADLANFRSFTIDTKGMDIVFDPYQVAAWAAGPQLVHIAPNALVDLIKVPALVRLWSEIAT